MTVLTHQDVFREAIRVCQPHLREAAVAGYLALAETSMQHGASMQALRACLLAAQASGEAEARRRRLAMDGGG
jgi:hypothetical protein